MPLYRKHEVKVIFTGHEHFLEHWIERYQSNGKTSRLDHIVTGGGGAPLYSYRGQPDTSAYLKACEKEKVALEQWVAPGTKPGDNPYHFIIAQVDGEKMNFEVRGIDWGSGYKPYSSNKTAR